MKDLIYGISPALISYFYDTVQLLLKIIVQIISDGIALYMFNQNIGKGNIGTPLLPYVLSIDNAKQNTYRVQQVYLLISKNQALQILYPKHCVYKIS